MPARVQEEELHGKGGNERLVAVDRHDGARRREVRWRSRQHAARPRRKTSDGEAFFETAAGN